MNNSHVKVVALRTKSFLQESALIFSLEYAVGPLHPWESLCHNVSYPATGFGTLGSTNTYFKMLLNASRLQSRSKKLVQFSNFVEIFHYLVNILPESWSSKSVHFSVSTNSKNNRGCQLMSKVLKINNNACT